MKKIYLKDKQGHEVLINVSEDVEKAYRQSLREEWRRNAYERYHSISLDEIRDFADENESIENILIEKEQVRLEKKRLKMLSSALDCLLPEQRDLIQKVYFEGKTQREIARQEGVDESAISKRMERIYIRLKKFFEKNEK